MYVTILFAVSLGILPLPNEEQINANLTTCTTTSSHLFDGSTNCFPSSRILGPNRSDDDESGSFSLAGILFTLYATFCTYSLYNY